MSAGVRAVPAPWPAGTPGLDPRWSRFVTATDRAGVERTWHVLDTGPEPTGPEPTGPGRTGPEPTGPERTGPSGDGSSSTTVSTTLLCVHGNPTWSYLWRRFLAAAPAGWRVVAVDQLGMGYSERPTAPRTLAERIDDLGVLTDALELTGPVVTLAHDWGGPVSLGWALAHGPQLRAVVLANTAVHQPDAVAPPALLRLAGAVRTTVCVTTPAFVATTAALSRPALEPAIRRALAAPYRSSARRQAVGDFVADIPFASDHPSRPTLDALAAGVATLDVPALIVWGPRDPVFGEVHLRDLQRRLPHADVQRYAGASHLVTEDAPQSVEHVWRWLADLEPPAPSGLPSDFPSDLMSDLPPQPTAPAPVVPLWSVLDHRADDPSPAVVEMSGKGDERWGYGSFTSFALLRQRVRDLAAGLAAHGVEPGHRVAVLVPPGVDLTATVYACWRAGAVVVVADAGLGLRSLGRALRSAGPDHVVGFPAALAAVAALRVPGSRIVTGWPNGAVRRSLGARHTLDELALLGEAYPLPPVPAEDDEAAVLFTSGATGPAKGVVYRFRQLHAQLELVRTVCRIGPTDRFVAAFAPFALYGPALGIPAVVPDMDVTRPGTLTARALARAIGAIEATVVFASPAALRNVVATQGALTRTERAALATVRTVLSAGAPVPLDLLVAVQELVPDAEVHTPYGMTEALPVTDVTLAQVLEAGTGNGVCVGRPLAGVTVRVSPLDAAGAAEGELTDDAEVTGEICVAAAHVKDRYDRLWAAERASSRTVGWHRTGDVGHLDAVGRLWVEGRLGHVITSAAGPITPVGPEQRIQQLDGVAAAAVAGVGPAGTQQVVAAVVPVAPHRVGLAAPELAAAVRAAAQVELSAVLVVPDLPVDIRHASKVDRAAVARWATRVLSGGSVRRSW